MDIFMNLLSSSVAVIGGSDGPTTVVVSGELPLPAIVVSVFAVLFVAYVYIMKAINAKKTPVAATTETAKPVQAAAAVQPANSRDSVLLENVDEKTAAVIMAIVSDKSGVPLEKLAFTSIKLMEDK